MADNVTITANVEDGANVTGNVAEGVTVTSSVNEGTTVTAQVVTGAPGRDGVDGIDGQDGADGVGVPAGGSVGQVIAKNSSTDYDTSWADVATIPAGNDLTAVMDTLVAAIPSTLGTGTSQNYRSPTDAEATAVVKGLKLIAQEAGKAYASIDLTTATDQLAPYGITVSKGYDSVSKRPYALAQSEFTYPSSSNYRAWGNYFFDLSQPVSLVIEAPHPQTDGNSEYIALRNWQNVPGALYVMSSVNRKAKDYMVTELSTDAVGGTFTLTFRGQTTAALAYNSTTAQVQTAIEALSTVGVGNVIVTGDPVNTSLHTFINLNPSLYSSGSPTDTITGNGASLTGGTLTIEHDADAAHNYNSLFTKVISAFALQGYAQLQLHGYSDVSSGVPRIFGAILSRGSSNDTKMGETVRSALEANGFDVARKGSFATQGLYVTGAPIGGSIVLAYNGTNTAAIPYSTNQATFATNVQTALEAHPNIGTGNIAVTQSQNDNTGVSQALVLTFKGALYHQGLSAITVTTNSLTGGTSPTASGLTAEGTALTAQSNTQGDIAEANGTVFMHLEMSQTVRTSATLSARLVAALANINLPQLSAAAMPVLAEAGHSVSQSPLTNGSSATIGTSPIAARADHRHAMTNSPPSGGDYVKRNTANNAWIAVAPSQIKTDIGLVSDLAGKVSKTADTMTGDLTLDGSAGQRDLTLTSSASGGIKNSTDTFPITDSTSRINLESYQPHFNSYGESIRINLKDPRAKGMITYQGNWTTPNYSGSDYTWLSSNPVDPVTIAWIGAHFLNNDNPADFAGNLDHGHFNIEVPDSTGALRTRFEVKLIDEDTGKFGVETTSIRTNKANFEFQIASGNEKFRLVGSDLRNKDIEFVETKRGVNPTFTLRGGAVTTGDFELHRWAGTTRVDSGTPFKIARISGLISLGNGTSNTVAEIVSTDATTTSPIFIIETANSGRRAIQFKVTGDTTNRFNMFADGKVEWGSGTAARDTNLYRSAADTLKTDDSLVVGASLTTAYTITSAALTLSAAHQTVEVTAGVGITLPTAVGIAGRTYDIINVHTATITVTANGTEKIGNTTAATSSLSIAAGDGYSLISNGTSWRIK